MRDFDRANVREWHGPAVSSPASAPSWRGAPKTKEHAISQKLNREIAGIGIDIGKNSPSSKPSTKKIPAEILALRNQLNVLRRSCPKRMVLGNIHRLLLVGLYRLAPGGAGRSEDHKAGDAAALAPRWFPSLLALEISIARRLAVDTGRHSLLDPRDEHRKLALARAGYAGNCSSSASMSDRPRSQRAWQGDGDRRSRFGCCTDC